MYTIAIRMFGEQGYEATTMRAIARAAGVSPGLLYKYFPNKRAVVHALYDSLSAQYASEAVPLPTGSWTERYFHALEVSLSVLTPHRSTLAALSAILIGDESEGLFARGTTASRQRVMGVFIEAVVGAEDAPDEAEALGRLAYVAHLAVILSWLLDKSPEQRATWQLLEQVAGLSGLLAAAALLPQAEGVLQAGDTFCREGLFGE